MTPEWHPLLLSANADQKSLKQCFRLPFVASRGRQIAIENSVSDVFDLRSSIALAFSIAAYPVCFCFH